MQLYAFFFFLQIIWHYATYQLYVTFRICQYIENFRNKLQFTILQNII